MRELAAHAYERGEALTPGQPTCPYCDDIGWVSRAVPVGHPDFGKAFPCRCQEAAIVQRRVDKVIADAGVLERFRGSSFEQFTALCHDDLTGKDVAFAACQQIAGGGAPVIDGSSLPGIILSGPYGVGKSGLAALALFGRAARGESVLCIDWQDFAAQVQNAYGRHPMPQASLWDRTGRSEGPSADQLIRTAASATLLMIDELGQADCDEQGNRRPPETPNKRGIFEQLIRQRHARFMTTIVTTNASTGGIKWQFGEYTYQRIGELCHWIPVGGISLRFV